jgi:acetate kinase
VTLLTVNVGSSSVRLVAYDEHDRPLAELHAERGELAAGHEQAAKRLLPEFVARERMPPLEVIAHRVVHGGERFTTACRLDAQAEAHIEALDELAPLHNPPALAWIRVARTLFPQVPQVAVFDTAFFAQLPAVARSYALAQPLVERYRLRRYGFHGLAHSYLWRRWQQMRPPGAGGRVISLQLGSGCSMAAIRDGVPLDTSMGFSPLEGLVMGTRCGDVDAGLLLYLQRQENWSAERMERWLNEQCGLLGVSGESADVRTLLQSASEGARRALELFTYRARKYLGAYLTVLGGADAILFGGGIGEHSPDVRARILHGLEWAGVELDEQRNAGAQGAESRIATAASRIDVRVVAVDESLILASEARALLSRS